MKRELGIFVVLGSLVALGFPSQALAQPSGRPAMTFRELSGVVPQGLRVVLTTTDGTRVRGSVESLGPLRLSLATGGRIRDFDEASTREVRRRGDRLWNGALLGAGVGFLTVGLVGASSCRWDSDKGFCFVLGGAVIGAPAGILVGMAIDALQPHDDVLYSHPQARSSRWTVEPLLGGRGHGLRLAKTF
jgi:hypothetical protein